MEKGKEGKKVERKEGYTQVCIWPGTIVGADKVEEFEKFLMTNFGVRSQYLEEIETAHNTDDGGHPIPNTGGRNDLFFAIHVEDSGKFAVPRLQHGISWIEDTLAVCNYRSKIYPARVFKYKSWKAGEEEE